MPLKSVIRSCAARGLTGLEKLFGIPGTVGGALKMNAGSFGAAISDCLISLRYMDERGDVQKRRKDEMRFGYRSSSIPDRHCVVEATFELTHAEPSRIQADMDYVWHERLRKHPMETAFCRLCVQERKRRPLLELHRPGGPARRTRRRCLRLGKASEFYREYGRRFGVGRDCA